MNSNWNKVLLAMRIIGRHEQGGPQYSSRIQARIWTVRHTAADQAVYVEELTAHMRANFKHWVIGEAGGDPGGSANPVVLERFGSLVMEINAPAGVSIKAFNNSKACLLFNCSVADLFEYVADRQEATRKH